MELQTAKGVKDCPPEEKILKNEVIAILQRLFEKYGFLPLETPILERYETLSAKFAAGVGSEVMKEIFRLKDQGSRKLGLRYDLTVPLARYVGMNPQLKMPFKRYEIGKVFRDGPLKLGRQREFWQCDIDIVGSNSMLCETEVLAVADEFFKKIKIDTAIKINNRKLLNGILEEAGVDKNKEAAIVSIDKLDKIGEEGVKTELKAKGLEKKSITNLLKLIKIKSLPQLKAKIKNNEGQEGIKELEELFNYLKLLKVNLDFDPSLARGLAYYTGTVFEIFQKKSAITSSLAAGGRYDKLIGNFLGKGEYPAIGLAFGLTPIMEILKLKKSDLKKTATKVYVIPIKVINEALLVVKKLREKKINTDFDLLNRGISKNLEYASSQRIPYVIFVGERELKEGKIKLRDMTTGEEWLLKLDEAIKKLE